MLSNRYWLIAAGVCACAPSPQGTVRNAKPVTTAARQSAPPEISATAAGTPPRGPVFFQAIDPGCESLKVAGIRGTTFLTFGSGDVRTGAMMRGDGGIARVIGDRIEFDPSLLVGLRTPGDDIHMGKISKTATHAHVAGSINMVGHWPDAAFISLSPVHGGRAGEGPDFFRWGGSSWLERGPSWEERKTLLLMFLERYPIAPLVVFRTVDDSYEFDVLDGKRWLRVSGIPHLAPKTFCSAAGWPSAAVAFHTGDVLVIVPCTETVLAAHYSASTKRWEVARVAKTHSEWSFTTPLLRVGPNSALLTISRYNGDGVPNDHAESFAYFNGTSWSGTDWMKAVGLPTVPASFVTSSSGDEWAIADGRIWWRPSGELFQERPAPTGTRSPAVELAEGADGDIWVRLKDGSYLRNKPLASRYACDPHSADPLRPIAVTSTTPSPSPANGKPQ